MNTYRIKYKSYMGDIDYYYVDADSEYIARVIFERNRTLSEIIEVIEVYY